MKENKSMKESISQNELSDLPKTPKSSSEKERSRSLANAFPADFSQDPPEFSDEELERELEKADKE